MIRLLTTLLVLCHIAPQVHAHALPKQVATMKIKEASAFFVVPVPLSAFPGVDDNGDGRATSDEIDAHHAAILARFHAGFVVEDAENPKTWILPPEGNSDHHDGDTLLFLHRVDFQAPPTFPKVTYRLFGTGAGEEKMTLRATRGPRRDVATLSARASSHVFFKDTDGAAGQGRGLGGS